LAQLSKNKINAIIISAITVISFVLTSALVNIFLPNLFNQDRRPLLGEYQAVRNDTQTAEFAALTSVLLLIMVAILAFWLYRFFGEGHFGKRGAVRWALFGVLFALLLKIPNLFFSNRAPFITSAWGILSVFVAYFLGRKLIPLYQPR